MREEAQVLARDHLRHENDLARVLSEMLDHMKHRLHSRHSILLNFVKRFQLTGGETCDDSRRFFDSGAQSGGEFRGRSSAARVEFPMAHARIRRIAERRDNPLAHIAGQVQHQIAHGVFVLMAARPDLVVIQLPQADLDPAGELPQLFYRALQKQRFDAQSSPP